MLSNLKYVNTRDMSKVDAYQAESNQENKTNKKKTPNKTKKWKRGNFSQRLLNVGN